MAVVEIKRTADRENEQQEGEQTEDAQRHVGRQGAVVEVAGQHGAFVVLDHAAQGGVLGEINLGRVHDEALAKPEVLGQFGPDDPPHLGAPFGRSHGVIAGLGGHGDGQETKGTLDSQRQFLREGKEHHQPTRRQQAQDRSEGCYR